MKMEEWNKGEVEERLSRKCDILQGEIKSLAG